MKENEKNFTKADIQSIHSFISYLWVIFASFFRFPFWMKFKFIKSLMVISIFAVWKCFSYENKHFMHINFIFFSLFARVYFSDFFFNWSNFLHFIRFFILAWRRNNLNLNTSCCKLLLAKRITGEIRLRLNDFTGTWKHEVHYKSNVNFKRRKKILSAFHFCCFYCFQPINCVCFFFYFILFIHNKSF